MKISRYICFAVLLLLFRYPSYASAAGSNVMAHAVEGTIDIRNQSFATPVQLKGRCYFFWQQLLAPGEKPSHEGLLVNFPSLWTKYTVNGKDLPAFGYGTYRVTVLLPHKHQKLKMGLPEVYCAYKLFVNNVLVAQDGKVSTSPAGFEPHWSNKMIDVFPGQDTLQLTLQIANFAHSEGGIKKAITLADRGVISLARRRAEAIDLLLCGCLFMGGLFFMGLYLMGNHDKAILFFALFAVVYSYRIVGVDNYVLEALLPNVSWYIKSRLEYMSLFGGIGLFAMYCRYLYPDEVNKFIVNGIACCCFLFAALVLVLPASLFTLLINPFLGLMLFCIIYTPFVYMQAYRHKRPGSIFALLSSLVLVVIFLISLLHYLAIIVQIEVIAFICYIAFFFLQSLILSHRVSFELKKARVAAEEGLKAKSDFLSTMSHEIRTPLNSVIGMSHLLLQNRPRQDQREQLDVIMFSANNLLTIVNDILDYNKIEAGKIVFEHIEMDLVVLGKNIINSLEVPAKDKGIALKYTLDDSLRNKVFGDPTRLTQVITNLVHNAVKFTPKGYVELAISVKHDTESDLTLEISVKDTGIGISPEKQKIIFDRFTQADSSTSRGFGGTGLGLAISKRLLELQNSLLQLNSKEGEGSTFYFVQTFEKGGLVINKQEIDDVVVVDEKPLAGVSLLLADDNPMNVMVAQAFLKRWGATIEVAQNGVEAINKLDVNKHKLVLMDLQMPEMDGYEATRQMRKNGVTIPIIALTANLPAEVATQIRQAGMNDIIIKPFLPDDLFQKIAKYVTSKKLAS